MYIEQAYKGDNKWWKVWITTLITTGIFLLNLVIYLFTSKEDMDEVYEMMKSIPNNLGLVINLAPFVILFAFLVGLVILLHKRSFVSLTTSRNKIDFKRIFFSFGLVTILTLAGFAYSYSMNPDQIELNFNLLNFVILLIISLILFPFQIGFEEYLFRGFLMQQIGVAVRNRWFPLIVTSLLFGIFHSANPEVAEMGYITMVFYIGTGLLLGIMTLMDEGLELALGFHLGNNLLASLLITSEWSALQTDAIFKYVAERANDSMVSEMIISMIIMYPLILFVLAKKYKWTNWKERLMGKVKPPGDRIAEQTI